MYLLTPEIKVNLKLKDREYSHLLRQPTIEDLEELEFATLPTIELKGDDLTTHNSNVDPDLFMYKKILKNTTGYPDAGNVPLQHKLGVMAQLDKVEILTEEEVEAKYSRTALVENTDDVVVYLEVKRFGETHLCTFFMSQPTEENYQEYKRIKTPPPSQRKKKHIYMKAKPTFKALCNFFDSLVKTWIGYTTEEATEVPKSLIPPFHKHAVIEAFFTDITDGLNFTSGK